MNNNISVSVIEESRMADTNIAQAIYDLDKQIDALSCQADNIDYYIAIASGILCSAMDILWVGDFDLGRGRDIAGKKVDEFVQKAAKLLGCPNDGVKEAVSYLEKFHIPSDGNTPDFGGGLQHHLRDFAHHPTIVGLMFSLLSQFTGMSYGTDRDGRFIVVRIPDSSRKFIGETVPDKVFKGTIIWMFHLISDMAGTKSSAGNIGGTGIPGPILSMMKEISSLPFVNEIRINDRSFSELISKMFNGTLFAQHDENNKIIKGTEIPFDFRGELGAMEEIGRQAVPVIANDCIVRAFYFIRRFFMNIKKKNLRSIDDFANVDWHNTIPEGNPTIASMLLISSSVFSTIDIADAIISKKYFVAINYVGIGRVAVAIGTDTALCLKSRNVKKIKAMYEEIDKYTYTKMDNDMYDGIKKSLDIERFGLTMDQIEILYNIQYQKILYDAENTKTPVNKEQIIALKREWAKEWWEYISMGYPDFVGDADAELHWYDKKALIDRIAANKPERVWFRLVLLEAMLFEPYYPLSIEKDKKGNEIPSKKYNILRNLVNGYHKSTGDTFLDDIYAKRFVTDGYVKRLRKTHNKVMLELREVTKTVAKSLAIGSAIAIITITTAGMFAPSIAVGLVGTNFAGLHGAALTSACLAYIGGGAIAYGGGGILGGTMAIVGGSAILGLGVGSGTGFAIGATGIIGKTSAIEQSAKLMVSIREIFLNDEHDVEYSRKVFDQYRDSIEAIENQRIHLELEAITASKDANRMIRKEMINLEDAAHVMKIAMKSINRFKGSFEEGIAVQE